MTPGIILSDSEELRIIYRGNKIQSIFFFTMGFIFQILFLWAYWSFLDTSGPWAYFWLGVINSDFFPFTSLFFIFGGGCFLIAIKEGIWIESWIIKKDISLNKASILRRWQLFRWSKTQKLPIDQIQTIRIHKIPLDTLKLINRYQLEVDYQETDETPPETVILYSDDKELAGATVIRLADKIQEILNFPGKIERKEASQETHNLKKKKEKE